VKLVCDEGVDRSIVAALRAEGHDVSYVAELRPGIPDDEVLALAEADEAVVVTTDKDFGELVFRQGLAHHGIVLLRLHGLTQERRARIVARGIGEHGAELAGAFAVIDANRIRIRRRAAS
jgi:predicted nuclease of predicted toxin-antitoxin system